MTIIKDLNDDFLINELKARGYIMVFWTRGDVEHAIHELGYMATVDAIDAIVEAIEAQFDASIGVNWDTIGSHVHDHFNPRKEPQNEET